MPVRLLLLVSSLMFAAPGAPLQVTASDGRVTIRATRAPLSDILQELARKTGMEVVYESAVPRQPITTTIENLPEEDAIAKLLDGLPLSWGVKLSANRRRVERLVLADPSKRAGSRPKANAPEPSDAQEPSKVREPSDVPPPREPSAASYPSERAGEGAPRPTPRPTATPTPRPTPSPTAKPTPSPRPTARPTARPTSSPTARPTSPKPSPTARAKAMPTPTPKATPTPRP